MSEENKDEATGAGAVIGFQVPVGIKKRKAKVDELLRRNPDINEGHVLAYLTTLDESSGEAVGRWLDLDRFDEVATWVKEHVIREFVSRKVAEVVRKKAGGRSYALYAPNQGKRKAPKEAGTFPNKLGAKRAELARFPPKDPQKLARLRKQVQRLSKKPEREQPKPKKPAKLKKEEVVTEAAFPMHSDLNAFMAGLKGLPKQGPQRGQYITAHMSHGPFLQSLQSHPQGKQVYQQLMGFLNSQGNAGFKPGATQARVGQPQQLRIGGESKVNEDDKTDGSGIRPYGVTDRNVQMAKPVKPTPFQSLTPIPAYKGPGKDPRQTYQGDKTVIDPKLAYHDQMPGSGPDATGVARKPAPLYGMTGTAPKPFSPGDKTTQLGQILSQEKENVASEAVLRKVISHLIRESLFREERSGSAWDDVIGRLSSKALTGDKRFQTLQRNIEKRTQTTLEQALAAINKGVKDKHTKVKGLGVKHSPESGKIFLPFNVELDDVEVGPIAIYVENGVPKIELSEESKDGLMDADPGLAKELRANLILVQERVLDRMDELTGAIEARDKYLEKLEGGIDKYVAGLTSLELSLLKNTLMKKYRGR